MFRSLPLLTPFPLPFCTFLVSHAGICLTNSRVLQAISIVREYIAQFEAKMARCSVKRLRHCRTMKQELLDLIQQLSREGQAKAGQFQDQDLEGIYNECSVQTPGFYEGRLVAAFDKKSRGEHLLCNFGFSCQPFLREVIAPYLIFQICLHSSSHIMTGHYAWDCSNNKHQLECHTIPYKLKILKS